MATWNKFINESRRTASIFKEIVAKGGLTLDFNLIHSDSSKVTGSVAMVLEAVRERIADKIEILITGTALCTGPKIFRPSVGQLQACEQVSVNLELTDYVQPFEVVIIELPERYQEQKTVHNLIGGQALYGKQQPPEHWPIMVTLMHRPRTLFTMVNFSSRVSIKSSLVHEEGMTVEDLLAQFTRADEWKGCMHTTTEEWEVTKDAIRSAINYMLLIDECGHRRIGRENEKHAVRLMSRGQSIREIPVLYELNQKVKLFRTVSSHNDLPSEPNGRVMPPHHRRGHYRMQPHGPGNALRKRVRIPPVFVNAYLFAGDMIDAKVVYDQAEA